MCCKLSGKAANLVQGVMKTTYEKAEECFNTNYYGCTRVIEALLPWLELSTVGARIVNVSSLRGALWVSFLMPFYVTGHGETAHPSRVLKTNLYHPWSLWM